MILLASMYSIARMARHGAHNSYNTLGHAPVLAPDREFCESEVRRKNRKPPHLLMVRAGNSLDPGPVWLRQEAKRGAQ